MIGLTYTGTSAGAGKVLFLGLITGVFFQSFTKLYMFLSPFYLTTKRFLKTVKRKQ